MTERSLLGRRAAVIRPPEQVRQRKDVGDGRVWSVDEERSRGDESFVTVQHHDQQVFTCHIARRRPAHYRPTPVQYESQTERAATAG